MKKETKNSKIVTIFGVSLLLLLVFAFILGIYLFTFSGFFRIIGVEYESNGALFQFVVFYVLLAMIFEFLGNGLTHYVCTFVHGKKQKFFTRMVIECTLSWLALHTVDEFMHAISIPWFAEIGVVIILFFVEWAFEDDKK